MNKNLLLLPASLAAIGIVVVATQLAPPAPPAPQLCKQPTVVPSIKVTPQVEPPPAPPTPTPLPRPTMPRPQSAD
jgi:hypothetical protein